MKGRNRSLRRGSRIIFSLFIYTHRTASVKGLTKDWDQVNQAFCSRDIGRQLQGEDITTHLWQSISLADTTIRSTGRPLNQVKHSAMRKDEVMGDTRDKKNHIVTERANNLKGRMPSVQSKQMKQNEFD
ncbi:hypothetical protein B0T20DRAFT_91479 [Sordaria brevicollis]|uniref:Uncharacterized protein n=1 Tax=Sordaria brevicollis TaxID=83679 RepID=A0AAE0NWR3_SORBR|nr:hypothetical protein B0T20DRAFT_91479 [Sordaria brevicollis]